MHDLDALKDVGVNLSCQRIYFGGDSYACVNSNYLTEEWQLTKRTLKVNKIVPEFPVADQFVHTVREAMEENQLTNAKTILLSFDSEFDDDQELNGLPENVVVIKNVARALNKVILIELIVFFGFSMLKMVFSFGNEFYL